MNWLPAVEVRGEGIFIEFERNAVKDWVSSRDKNSYAIRLDQKIKKRINNAQPNLVRRDSVTEEFLLVHSFAHAIIRQLAFECGYDASSLKERIFVGKNEHTEMCAVLIYTASGDSEGSLGGLVQRAQPGLLENTIKEAVFSSLYCSNDPICSSTGSAETNSDNIVSCHACNMLPETSCEHSNYLLDRSSLVGNLENTEQGYFNELIKSMV